MQLLPLASSGVPIMGAQLWVTLTPQGKPFMVGLLRQDLHSLSWAHLLRRLNSEIRKDGLSCCVSTKERGEKGRDVTHTPSTICPSSSPAFQKAYCHSHREVPNFDKNLKVHMDFEKRVGGNSKVSIKNLSLDGEIERLIFIGNFNAFLILANIMIMYWFHKHKIICLIFFFFFS